MELRVLSEVQVRDLDRGLADAIKAVEVDGAGTADVGLAFKVGRDKDGNVIASFTLKTVSTVKGEFFPPPSSQLRLSDLTPSSIESVEFSHAGGSVTLGKKGRSE